MGLLATSFSRRHCRRPLNTNEIRKDGITSRTKRHNRNSPLLFCRFPHKRLRQLVRLNDANGDLYQT